MRLISRSSRSFLINTRLRTTGRNTGFLSFTPRSANVYSIGTKQVSPCSLKYDSTSFNLSE